MTLPSTPVRPSVIFYLVVHVFSDIVVLVRSYEGILYEVLVDGVLFSARYSFVRALCPAFCRVSDRMPPSSRRFHATRPSILREGHSVRPTPSPHDRARVLPLPAVLYKGVASGQDILRRLLNKGPKKSVPE